MTRLFRTFLIALLAFAAAIPLANGQGRAAYSRAEIDQMLAPIALYPDPLLSQLLMAATFPEDVTEAARWSRAHPGVEGDAAVRMVQEYEWDPSVKSLVAFPRVLARMEENPDWTRRLGDAFIVQEPVVMEAIQDLRRRAQDNGQLASDDRMRVIDDQPGSIAIEPANPQSIYVPYYDPMVAYGAWWWPAYPPYYWAPWPGYVAYGPGFWWGAPVGLSVGFFFGGFDWYHRHPYVRSVGNYYVRPSWVGRNVAATPGRWQQNYWGGRSGGSYARAYNPVTRPQFHPPMPLRDAPRSFTQSRVQAAPQQQFAPRQQQSFAPRVDSQQRFEARQNWQARQAAPEWRRSAEQRAQAPVQQRQAAPQVAPRQQAAPQQFAPRFERREMRAEQRQQRFSAPRADRGGGEHSRGGGHRFN